ncbi:hemolysin family protein [Yunchengibacter salinarum]|uniref:hemolysin family protein n=1 Tax=Yunchengibacter salinarum TaxID=3133399 RepID=UPI0035B646BE
MAEQNERDQGAGGSGIVGLVRTLFGGGRTSSLRESLEETIEEHHAEDGVGRRLSDDERAMLLNILAYGEIRVGDVMVPRADIVAADVALPLKDFIPLVADAAHSRIPVYRETLDDVRGMVHVKDVLKAVAEERLVSDRLGDLQRPVLFVPHSMRVMDLLARMRANRTHMAIVVDEYGGTDGLVTIEDLVEQIVGEIEDEHDEAEEPQLVAVGDGSYDADARIEVEALEATLGMSLLPADRDEDVDTLGGLVFALAGRVPEIGETIGHEAGIAFEVVDADPRRIRRLRIHTDLTTVGQGESGGRNKAKGADKGADQGQDGSSGDSGPVRNDDD